MDPYANSGSLLVGLQVVSLKYFSFSPQFSALNVWHLNDQGERDFFKWRLNFRTCYTSQAAQILRIHETSAPSQHLHSGKGLPFSGLLRERESMAQARPRIDLCCSWVMAHRALLLCSAFFCVC